MALPNIHSTPSWHKRDAHPPFFPWGKKTPPPCLLLTSYTLPKQQRAAQSRPEGNPRPNRREAGDPPALHPWESHTRVQAPGLPEPGPSLYERGAHRVPGCCRRSQEETPCIKEDLTALAEAVFCPRPQAGTEESTPHPSWARLPRLWLTHQGNLPYLSIHLEGQAPE